MNKIRLILTILAAGAASLLIARQSTVQLQREINATVEAWSAQTQMVVVAQREEADLKAHLRELEEALNRPKATEPPLWSALQANRAGHLPLELRERLLQEFGFNWGAFEDFIVVSKDALRETGMRAIRSAKLTDEGSAALAMTPAERDRVNSALQRAREEFNQWALAHTERAEPQGDVVAQYTLKRDRAMSLSLSNNFASLVLDAVGKQRGAFVLLSAQDLMVDLRVWEEPTTIIIRRYGDGIEQRFNVQQLFGSPPWKNPKPKDLSQFRFPKEFLPVFPSGWADIAKREGFELLQEALPSSDQNETAK